jgi:hypothetical protein
MKKNEHEWILFSDMHARAMQDPEFRKLYESHEEEEMVIRAKIEARIKAKKLKENKIRTIGIANFAT